MADLLETSTFAAGITRIETNEPVIGGEDGVANRAPKLLASRTRWLKDQLDALAATLGSLYALRTGDYTTLRARATTKEDVGLGSVANYPPTNDASGGSASQVATARAVKDHVAAQAGSVIAGNGLTGGGAVTGGAALALATPATLSGTTVNAALPVGHTHAISSTAARNSASTAILLQAKAMSDHVAAGDHDGRYARLSGAVFTGTVETATRLIANGGNSALNPPVTFGTGGGGGLTGVNNGANFEEVGVVINGAIEGHVIAGDAATRATTLIDRRKGDARYAPLAAAWPGVFASSAANHVTFPVGTTLLVTGNPVALTQTAPVRLGEDSFTYTTAGSGAILTGLWRARGSSGTGATAITLMERTE